MKLGILDSFVTSVHAAAGRMKEAVSEDPRDTRGEAVPPAPARPAMPAAFLQAEAPAVADEPDPAAEKLAWFRTLRGQAMPEIVKLSAQLEAKELKGEAFQKAARTLQDWRNASDDPLLGRACSAALTRYFKWEGLTDWQVKLGKRQAGAELVAAMARQVDGHRGWFVPSYPEQALNGLVGALESESATPAMVRNLAASSSAWYERANQKLEGEAREHESPEDDRRYGDACAGLLQQLWLRGDFEVVRDGLVLSPGSVELAESLRERRLPVDRWAYLDLSEPAGPAVDPEISRQATELSRQLARDSWAKEPDGCIALFDDLVRTRPEQAGRVADELVRQVLEPRQPSLDACGCVGAILSHGSPEAAQLFDPHLDELSRYTTRKESEGALAWNGSFRENRVELYQGLLHRRPELATPEFLADQIVPLAVNGISSGAVAAHELLLSQMAGVPGAARAVAERVLEDRSTTLRTEAWTVLSGALDQGWQPDAATVDLLAAEAYRPTQREDDSLARTGKSMAVVAGTLARLSTRHPVELVAPDGTLKPFQTALLEQMVFDPRADVRDYFSPTFTKNSQLRPGIKEIYASIFPAPAEEEKLLQKFEAAYDQAGKFKLPRDAEMAVTILHSLEMSAERRDRLRPRMSQELERDQGWYVFNDIVNSYRDEYKQVQMDVLKDPASDEAACLKATREYVRCELFRTRDFSLRHSTSAPLDALGEKLGPSSARVADQLLDGVMVQAAAVGDLCQLENETVKDAWIGFGLLTRPGPPSLERLESLLPLLARPCSYSASAMRALRESLGALAKEVGGKLLADPTTDAESRLRAVKLGGESSELVEPWFASAATRPGWEGELARSYQDGAKAFQAFEVIVGLDDAREERWATWQRLSARLGGEAQHGPVLGAVKQWIKLTASGVPSAEADGIALRRYLADGDGGPSVSSVTVDDQKAVIGGVRLAVKKRS